MALEQLSSPSGSVERAEGLTRSPGLSSPVSAWIWRSGQEMLASLAAPVLQKRGGERTHLPIGLALAAILLALTGCAGRQPILIGFSAELTGKRAELGVAARDGAQLAVDLVNESGGINGRPLELIVRNDQGDPDVARQVDAELVEQGVVAIVGHITSEQTAAVFDYMNQAQVVLLSPTSSSTEFGKQADYFFRVMPSNRLFGEALAVHIYTDHDAHQLLGIYDLDNQSFTETFWHSIQTQFEALGGDAQQAVTFRSGQQDLKEVMAKVKAADPDSVVFIASAVDTALMAQYGRQIGLEADLFSSTWAQTEELLAKGGQAVEGMELSAVYNPQNPNPAFREFVERFETRYKRPPGLSAVYAYESVLVLAHALEQTGGRAAGLADTLTTIRGFEGAQGPISLDEYGDVIRDVYMVMIQGGEFQLIGTISPEGLIELDR